MDELERLLADGIIDAVLGRLKSGKEADLWLVQHAGQVVAAKVYRERDFRSFKNDAAYKEGRLVGNSGPRVPWPRAAASGGRPPRRPGSPPRPTRCTSSTHGVRTRPRCSSTRACC
jgi:hypothetical protein